MKQLHVLFLIAVAGLLVDCASHDPYRVKPDALWDTAAPLSKPRELPRLVPFADGSILVVGGGSELRHTAFAETEIFQPTENKWRPGPTLATPRRDAEVVQLQDGRILAIGGSDGPTRTGISSVEVLDASHQSWLAAASMEKARIGHTAVVLRDGRVLVVGGLERPGVALASAEIYDPTANQWRRAGDLHEPRSLHHARLMQDGTVLVIGGGTEVTATDTVEVFDPKAGTWTLVGSLKEPRWGFASAVLPDGRVVVAGGRVPAQRGATLAEDRMIILNGTEIYDPKTRTWSSGAPMHVPRSMGLPNVTLVSAGEGQLMFAGGRTYPAPYHGSRSVEIYDVRRNEWRAGPSLRVGRSYMATIALRSGEILTVGGRGPEFLPLTDVEKCRVGGF